MRPIQASGASKSSRRRRCRRARRTRRRRRSPPRRGCDRRAADDRRDCEHRQREDRGERQQVDGRQRRGDRARRQPAATSIRYCSAPPITPPPGATFASALPASCDVTIGRQARAVQRHALQRPEAGERGCLQRHHAGEPADPHALEIVPRAERRQQARHHEVERDAGDRSPAQRISSRRRGRASQLRARSACSSARCSTTCSRRSTSGTEDRAAIVRPRWRIARRHGPPGAGEQRRQMTRAGGWPVTPPWRHC